MVIVGGARIERHELIDVVLTDIGLTDIGLTDIGFFLGIVHSGGL
jgi:hypothetical protein